MSGQHPSACPNCLTPWLSESTMIEDLRATGVYDEDKLEETASCYGWTPENDLRFGANVTGVYCRECDMTVHWKCAKCGHKSVIWRCEHGSGC